MRTQVGTVRAGPAGLLLSHLHRAGIDTLVLERRSRRRRGADPRRRARAGHGRPAERSRRRRAHAAGGADPPRDRAAVRGPAAPHPIVELADGRAITVYGQHEVVKDLIAARLAAGGPLAFGPRSRRCTTWTARRRASIPPGRRGPGTRLRFRRRRLRRLPRRLPRRFPRGALRVFERTYPFAWLGILAEAPPASGRADLHQPRARLRAAQHALADARPALPPG